MQIGSRVTQSLDEFVNLSSLLTILSEIHARRVNSFHGPGQYTVIKMYVSSTEDTVGYRTDDSLPQPATFVISVDRRTDVLRKKYKSVHVWRL